MRCSTSYRNKMLSVRTERSSLRVGSMFDCNNPKHMRMAELNRVCRHDHNANSYIASAYLLQALNHQSTLWARFQSLSIRAFKLKLTAVRVTGFRAMTNAQVIDTRGSGSNGVTVSVSNSLSCVLSVNGVLRHRYVLQITGESASARSVACSRSRHTKIAMD